MKKLLILLVFLQTFNVVSAQNNSPQYIYAQQELQRRGEVYFSFIVSDLSQIAFLTQKLSISQVTEHTVFAYANQKEFDTFVTYGYTYNILTAPSELVTVKMSDNPQEVLTWNYYPTYTAYESIMQQFATDHPEICKLLTITTLASGRKILGLRISDNVNIQENEPEFLYTSSIHGDETTGYILMLHLADYLLNGYDSDDRITNMVNNTDIVICPLTNPDGTYKGGNNSVNGATRTNANNVDINRNFPDPKQGQHPDGNAWQPETVAFMNFSGFNSFTMGANFHGGAEVVNYPWDTWSKLSADDAWWIYTSRQYADTVHENAPSGYMTMMMNGITNGFAWYEISGGRQDYMNYFRNCRESTIEISDTKLLPENQLLAHWNYNYRSFLNHIEQASFGLHGLVTDSMSGVPLYARIYISGFDKDSSHVFTDPQVGDYHRLLKGGIYNVTYSCAGYTPKTFTVQINDNQTTVLDVQLYDGRLETSFKADTTLVAVDQEVTFSDLSAGHPQGWSWYFDGASPSTSSIPNPKVTYSQPGIYAVKLVISRESEMDSLMREAYIEVKPWYLMSNISYTVCDAHFFDAGGPSGQYKENENAIITFIPASATKKLSAIFNNLDIEEGGTDCTNDMLLVYDGTSVSDNLVATLCGNNLPQNILASNASGALTFEFESNATNSFSGWDITLTCDSNVGISEATESRINVYPNPVISGNTLIESDNLIEMLIIRDITGKILFSSFPYTFRQTVVCDFQTGIYLFQIQTKGKWISKRIQIFKN